MVVTFAPTNHCTGDTAKEVIDKARESGLARTTNDWMTISSLHAVRVVQRESGRREEVHHMASDAVPQRTSIDCLPYCM